MIIVNKKYNITNLLDVHAFIYEPYLVSYISDPF